MIVRVVVEKEDSSDKTIGLKVADEYPDKGDGKSVRKAILAALIETGRVPSDAKVGWLSNRNRRKGCSFEAHACLDAGNNTVSRAYFYYGQSGKQGKKRGRRGVEPRLFVSYLRVSTRNQGDSKLGLERQRDHNLAYIKMCGGKLIKEYTEIKSGRKNVDRPQVMEAIRHCQLTGATLIVETVCRLARHAHFVTGVLDSTFPLVIATDPDVTYKEIVNLAVEAQLEVEKQSQKTRASVLLSRKPKGARGRQNLLANAEAATKGRMRGAAAVKSKADNRSLMVLPYLRRYQNEGAATPTALATRLNADQILTARGKRGGWTGQAVRNLLARADALAPQNN